jgi:DNA-binding transcriptional LysR family regulator
MDLEELRAFLSVAETGSLFAAANALTVSRTTLRRRVESLEARAGAPLFDRTRKGIVLTAAGEVLAQRGRQVMQEAEALIASVRDVGTAPAGLLRLVLPVGMPPHFMVLWFSSLRRRFPLLRIHARFVDDPVGRLLEGVDIAIHFGPRPRGPWVSREIKRVREWLVATADYLERHGTPGAIEDLGAHPLYCWEGPGDEPRTLPRMGGGHLDVDPVLVATDIHMVRQCALNGLGIAFVPDALLPDPGAPSPLVPVLPELIGRERALRMTVPRVLADMPKIRAVLDHAQRRWTREPRAAR